MRLDGIEVTEDPNAADVFVCPGNIRIFEKETGVLDIEKLNRLPHFSGNESRHVFFDCSDNFTKPINLPILFIKCDARTWMLKDDPNTIQVAWPVEDYAECIPVPEGGLKYDVSFHGWLSTETRRLSSDACKNDPRLKSDIAQYEDFTGYCYHLPEGIRRRAEFRRSMHESRICLCPESIPGVLPYRFFEAMSAGRVPLLVGSDYVLPFEGEIPYGEFVIRCQRTEANEANKRAWNRIYNMANSDQELRERGLMARYYWEKFLDSRKWPEIMAEAVRAKLGVLQAA